MLALHRNVIMTELQSYITLPCRKSCGKSQALQHDSNNNICRQPKLKSKPNVKSHGQRLMFYPASFRSNPETYTVLCIRGTDELMVKHWYLKPHLIQDSKPSHRVLWRLHLGVTKGWITVSGSVSERKSQSSQKAQRPKRNVWKSDQSAYLTCEGMPFFT